MDYIKNCNFFLILLPLFLHYKTMTVSSDDLDKATIINDLFRGQTVIDEINAVLPQTDPYTVNSNINSLHFSPVQIESVLKSLKTGKVCILRKLSKELSFPFCSLFNQCIETGVFPQCWEYTMYVWFIYKNEIIHVLQTTTLFLSCVLQQKYGKSRL